MKAIQKILDTREKVPFLEIRSLYASITTLPWRIDSQNTVFSYFVEKSQYQGLRRDRVNIELDVSSSGIDRLYQSLEPHPIDHHGEKSLVLVH